MVLPHGTGDLYHKYRPRQFKEVAGHKANITSIRKALTASQPSQAYLLIGESGTGKTTTARIMALSLNCEERAKDGEPCLECKSCKAILSGACVDIIEKNAAEHRGIDAVREISATMPMMPMQVSNKVYILDEFHQMTKEAQSSLLKVLEEAPSRVFIILCTTHPGKVLPTVKNRCQRFKFDSLKSREIVNLLDEVSTYEAFSFDDKIIKTVAEASGGSPRNALVLLQQVSQLDKPTLPAIHQLLNTADEADPAIIKICLALGSPKTNWEYLMECYEEVKDKGAAAVGMVMAGVYRNKLIKSKNKAAAAKYAGVLELFIEPLGEHKLGENQLVLKLYKAYKLLREK